MEESKIINLSRREVIKAGAAMTAAAFVSKLGTNYAFAQGNDRIRVGVIGCGGRGSGAMVDAVKASKDVQIVALGDAFEWRTNDARKKGKDLGEQFAVADNKVFSGLDAYKKVIDSGVDMVILATPPGFRPLHLRAAVDAGKHVFMEKPVAVDPPGARSVMESGKIAEAKKLAIVTGTQRRHEAKYVETMKRIHEGALGTILSGQIYWNQGGLWSVAREKQMGDVEWQLRNWLYHNWLSGDHIVEQHVHNIDVMNWVMQGHPNKAIGMGGRVARTDPGYGHIYDHFAIEYEFPNNVRWAGQCRQIDGTHSRVGENVVGTKGTSNAAGSIWGENKWRFDGEQRSPYEQEHVDLIASIKAGTPLNEAQRIAESTLTAIMAREAAYTGQEVTWDQIMASNLTTAPVALDKLTLDMKLPVPPVPVPGKTKLERNEFDPAYISSMSPKAPATAA
jgi:predicted dehydrogenase